MNAMERLRSHYGVGWKKGQEVEVYTRVGYSSNPLHRGCSYAWKRGVITGAENVPEGSMHMPYLCVRLHGERMSMTYHPEKEVREIGTSREELMQTVVDLKAHITGIEAENEKLKRENEGIRSSREALQAYIDTIGTMV
jgi:hypothetical protein